MTIRVEHGDCLEVIPRLVAEGVLVDAIVTDPPYHLIQASRGGSTRQNDPTKPFGRAEARGGFMGQRWDGGAIAFQSETWAAISTALKPGGYLLAFGGSRTHHRIWSAIEDAGFVIQDTIMWLYGSGFPKGLAQLKPSFEPICVAYKPGGKRELQIDECRIPGEPVHTRTSNTAFGLINDDGWQPQPTEFHSNPNGRWPANLAHDGSGEVMEAFAAFGERKSSGGKGEASSRSKNRNVYGKFAAKSAWSNAGGLGDGGSVARYFYCAKAGKADRADSKHPTVKPIALMRWLVRLVTPPGGLALDPFAGSGSTGAAAIAEGRRVILVEREAEYISDIKRRLTTLQRQTALAV